MAGQHRPVDGRQVRQLDLFEVVDADRLVVAASRKEHFDEVGDDAELGERAGQGVDSMQRLTEAMHDIHQSAGETARIMLALRTAIQRGSSVHARFTISRVSAKRRS